MAPPIDRRLVRLRVPLGFVAGALYMAFARPTWTSAIAGLPLVVLGCAVRVWASGCISKNRALATGGPYRFVRHPLYVGSSLLVTGFAAASGSPWVGLPLVVLFAAVYLPVARREEATLGERFGADFARFRAAVPAFIPRLTPWRGEDGGGDGGFSWSAVARHREWRSIAGVVALYGVLIGRILWGGG